MSNEQLDNLVRIEQWRILDQAHRKRNLAEYQGVLEINIGLLAALIRTVEIVASHLAGET